MALFAALSYAVTQSGRGGGGIDRETAALAAAQIVQRGSLIESVIDRMRIAGGCSNESISFERSPFDGSDAAYVNPNAPADLSCHVFANNGGGISEIDIDNIPGLTSAASMEEFYGGVNVSGTGTTGNRSFPVGDPAPHTDLSLVIRNISEAACDAINNGNGLGITSTDGGDLNTDPFIGEFNQQDLVDGCAGTPQGNVSGNCLNTISDSPWGSRGIDYFCFIENNTGNRIFLDVVLAR